MWSESSQKKSVRGEKIDSDRCIDQGYGLFLITKDCCVL